MPKEYKECEECRTRNSVRSARCLACGGRLKLYRVGFRPQDRARGYAFVVSVGVFAAVIGIVLRRLT